MVRKFLFILLALISPVVFAANPDAWKDIQHVVMIVFENTDADDALRQPFMNSLTKTGAYLSQSYAITHPSQPNYIAMVAGSRLGVTSDANVNITGKHIGNLFATKGLTWKSYAENYPGNCYLRSTNGPYCRKHEPFLSFTSVQQNPTECGKIVPATQFFTDLAANRLPTFSLYVPDSNNDGHDTGVAFADNWLKTTFGPIFNNPTVMKNTLFIITFDEDDFSSVNRIYTLFVGAGVKPGATSSVHYDHYDVLRTIEDIFGLGNLGKNDITAHPILDIWATTTPPPVGECLPPKNIQNTWTADKRSITISWQKPDINVPVLDYQMNDWENNFLWKANSLSYTDASLPGKNGMYSYFLHTNCATGLSKPVEVLVTISDTPKPTLPCLPPANIRGTFTADKKSITLSWDHPVNSAPISYYQVGDYKNQPLWQGTELTFTDATLGGNAGTFRYHLTTTCASSVSSAVPFDVVIK